MNKQEGKISDRGKTISRETPLNVSWYTRYFPGKICREKKKKNGMLSGDERTVNRRSGAIKVIVF